MANFHFCITVGLIPPWILKLTVRRPKHYCCNSRFCYDVLFSLSVWNHTSPWLCDLPSRDGFPKFAHRLLAWIPTPLGFHEDITIDRAPLPTPIVPLAPFVEDWFRSVVVLRSGGCYCAISSRILFPYIGGFVMTGGFIFIFYEMFNRLELVFFGWEIATAIL